jgi:molybdopterin molybdotransferase
VCHRGEDLRAGETVLARGVRLSAVEVSVLAAVGCEPVPVFRKPRLALFATGDELVRPSEKPKAGQIREGNTFYLAARARGAGAEVLRSRPRPTTRPHSARSAQRSDGGRRDDDGRRRGRYDLVGAVLKRCGVEPVFHKVAIKPGKPLWFGMRGKVPVFALPGNPVSCLIGFEVFVQQALVRTGRQGSAPLTRAAGPAYAVSNPRAARARARRPRRRRRHAPRADPAGGARRTSSGCADALAVVAIGRVLAPGDVVEYRPLR